MKDCEGCLCISCETECDFCCEFTKCSKQELDWCTWCTWCTCYTGDKDNPIPDE